jgi:hypothetical protein
MDRSRTDYAVRDDRYRTPDWLHQSFVLPATGAALPSPREPEPDSSSRDRVTFVRPPAEEVDFAEVVRRRDACLVARRVTAASLLLALLTVLLLQLTGVPAYAVGCFASAAVAVAASLVRLRLERAPVPHRR